MMQLNNNYNRDEFLKFLEENFLTDFKKDIRPVSVKGFSSIQKAYSLGRSENLDLQVFEFSFEGSPNKRVILTKDAFKVMRSSAIFRALAIFHSPDSSDWRLSLMTASPERTEKGKVVLSYSNPKRLSFFLGPNAKVNTPTRFILKKDKIVDFNDLKSRFSIEVVNKEFYKEISEHFTKLVGGSVYHGKKKEDYKPLLKLPSVQDKSQTSKEFAVRLIGRVIFCWFLREKKSDQGKSLMPNVLLSLEAVKNNPDYYHKILEPIFFEILNKLVKSRKDMYAKEPFALIPYLNGGLFFPHDDDFYSYNEDKQAVNHNIAVIPNEWLISFFKVLETYNFTIDENTSFDEELSIDPEMLGRIFENLLAEINPETGESDRKSTGSYYTPRVIVDYMVDESLLLYLKNQTKIDDKKLRTVISYDLDDEETQLKNDEREQIINALERVKILDPACGSGAFPMGALQKIVFILQQADPEGQLWFKKQIKNTSPEIRKVIEREFVHKNFDYIRKLGIIRENIYGVDIQPIATEFSRLRCFLTLIVDERIQEDLENRGIEPLPNLDFKFVTANTLIDLSRTQATNQMGLFEDDAGIRELKELRDMFFNASGTERDQLKLQFVQAQNRMFQRLISEGRKGHADLTTKLTTWDPFSHRSASWFDPEWMFGIEDGFDIVIANPPYDVYQGEKKDDIEIVKRLEIYNISRGGKLNSYKLFLARSTQLQKDKGILCEIFQNSFLGDNSAKLLRKYFLDNQQIIQIVSFPERDNIKKRVFEAVKMSVCILISNKVELKDYAFELNVWDSKYMDEGFSIVYLKSEILKFDPLSAQIPLLDKNEKDLFSKIYRYSHAPITCLEGELNMTFHKKYFSTDSSKPKIIKGAAIQRYRITDNLSQGEVEYLNAVPYLKDFLSSKKSKDHESPRIVMQGITGVDDERRLIMAFLPAGLYCANSCNYILSTDSSYSLNYLLGLYNSRLINWIFKKTSTNSNVNCYEIENLPIPSTNSSNQQIVTKINGLVSNILSITKDNKNLQNVAEETQVKEYENQIDQMVYKLYDITPEEIEIVENSSK